MFKNIFAAVIFFLPLYLSAQNKNDTVVNIDGRVITLSEVVVNNKINVPAFIDRLRSDTTFYKAFRTLHIIGFSAHNDVRMVNKDQEIKASLRSKIKQTRNNNCRSMQVLEESTTGDIYDENKNFNYYMLEENGDWGKNKKIKATKTIGLRVVCFLRIEKKLGIIIAEVRFEVHKRIEVCISELSFGVKK